MNVSAIFPLPLNAACFVSGTSGFRGFQERISRVVRTDVRSISGSLAIEQLGPPRERAGASPTHGRDLTRVRCLR